MQNYTAGRLNLHKMASRARYIFTFLLVVLFTYAAVSKLLDFQHFRAAMLIQPFPTWISRLLVYLLPATELLAAGLLISRTTDLWGYWLSFILMAEFTGYVSLVLLRFWNTIPCSCGGILGGLSWRPHLVFNILFLLITIVALYIRTWERRVGGKE